MATAAINVAFVDGQWEVQLPVFRWPIVSINFGVPPGQTIWAVLSDVFDQDPLLPRGSELKVTHIERRGSSTTTNEKVRDDASGARVIPIRYGVVPDGMRQNYPGAGAPQPLEPAREYLVTTMEGWGDRPRYFSFRTA